MTISDLIRQFYQKKIALGPVIILSVCVLTVMLFLLETRQPIINTTDTNTGIGITDLVRKVKKELTAVEDSMVTNNEMAMFTLRDFEMEINFVVHEKSSGSVSGKYELVAVEGSKEYSSDVIQKLKLHWDAIPPQKDNFMISTQPITIP